MKALNLLCTAILFISQAALAQGSPRCSSDGTGLTDGNGSFALLITSYLNTDAKNQVCESGSRAEGFYLQLDRSTQCEHVWWRVWTNPGKVAEATFARSKTMSCSVNFQLGYDPTFTKWSGGRKMDTLDSQGECFTQYKALSEKQRVQIEKVGEGLLKAVRWYFQYSLSLDRSNTSTIHEDFHGDTFGATHELTHLQTELLTLCK